MKKLRPFLKWAGNKYHCMDHILASLPAADRLIEPFTGSGAVFINTHYPQFLLTEKNPDLVSLFCYVQQEGDSFIEYCKTFFCEENNTAERYLAIRQEFNQCQMPRLKAAMFLYLNRHGYNGLCRYNQKGIYNVPFGRYKKPYFPRLEMQYFHQKSQCATFIQSDFRQTLQEARRGDLIYCDPPYAPIKQSSNFSSYTVQKFGESDQIALAELALDCVNRGITVIISNHDTDFTRYHYRHGDIRSFSVKRNISCHPENRLPVKELLAIFKPS